ncbi:sarcosine oxidase subunit gamma [Zavarzinia sp. CC-PAN008]|uniref:sarcosine oxidase subunit gamma n=1 Tax=Zavarzinia sp. CC-PAN008 TaxID=3243332 RepID=UPI003F742F8A
MAEPVVNPFVLDPAFAMRASARAGVVRLAEVPQPAQFSLRGDAADVAFRSAVARLTGVSPPAEAGQVAVGASARILWLGPDEWLVVAPREVRAELAQGAVDGLAGLHAAFVDLSANRAVLSLTGGPARTLLAKGCGLDLHPRAFPAGQVRQSLVARIPVILEMREDGTNLFVRRSLAPYLAEWLLDAATEFA